MFSFEQIQMFLLAADKGSFSAAARSQGKSHSAISMAMSNLEDHFGVALFDRSKKYPTLTADGERFYQQAKMLSRQVQRMESAALSSLNEVEHKVRIGLGELIPFELVETILEQTASKFPDTRLSVCRGDRAILEKQLEAGELHMVIHSTVNAATEMVDFFAIFNLPAVCVCSPDSPLADMDCVDAESLMATRQICCQTMLENPILQGSWQVSPEAWDVTDQDDLLRLVEQGLGWAAVPEMLAQERVAQGTLNVFKPEFLCEDQTFLVDLWLSPNQQRGPVQTYLIERLKSLSEQR